MRLEIIQHPDTIFQELIDYKRDMIRERLAHIDWMSQ